MPPLPYTPKQLLADPDYQKGITEHFITATNLFYDTYGTWKNVWLSEQILFEAIAATYCDIYRLQVFRGIEHEDVHKRAAYLMKWVNKFRPIQLKNGVVTQMPSDILINELFAASLAVTLLNIHPNEFFNGRRVCGYAKNIVYLLRFHSCEAEQLASELYLLEQHAKTNWSSLNPSK